MATVVNDTSAKQPTAYWNGVLAMTLCAFALVASGHARFTGFRRQ